MNIFLKTFNIFPLFTALCVTRFQAWSALYLQSVFEEDTLKWKYAIHNSPEEEENFHNT